MLFSDGIKLACLAAGLLAISLFSVSPMTMDSPVMVVSAAGSAQEVQTEDTEVFITEREYAQLDAEEEMYKELLQTRESALDREDVQGQIEVMELQETIRDIQMQKMMLRAQLGT